ncbi:DUF2231 domain-containing protein [Pengzhenrongella sp.]|uniref:DUF2231 domain-containing protein n=1 Tax=Pengzhenrongella sp. TaxID=2888820 RepID=UPI002F92DDE3
MVNHVVPPVGAAARARSPWLGSAMRHVEELHALDPIATAAQRPAAALIASAERRDLLRGRLLAHPAHPFLTDVPLGAWMSASVLDVVGGRAARPAARLLVGLGLLAAIPAGATGFAEWATTDGRARRVGLLHAVVNLLALKVYASSWLARGRDAHGAGVALTMAGGLLITVGGYLGGHLAVALKVGSRDPAFADPAFEGASFEDLATAI